MGIIRFVFVLLLLLFFLFSPDNAVVQNRVWSCRLDSPKTLPTCFLYPREYCSYRHKSRLCAHKPAPFMPIRGQDTAVPFYAYQRTEGDAAQFADKHKRGRLGLTQRPLFCLPAGEVPFYAYHGGKKLKSSYLETTLFFRTVCPEGKKIGGNLLRSPFNLTSLN